jgi:5-formyltetrahydrofolate cyclo-ligase
VTDFTDAHCLCESSKSTIRARVLSARSRVDAPWRATANTALCAGLVGLVRATLGESPVVDVDPPPTVVDGDPLPTIVGYVPLPTEPGGADLPDQLANAARPCRLLLPVLLPDGDLDWAQYEGPDALRPGPHGLREPAGRRLGVAAIATARLVIVPAVAVDLTGIRLGHGGGSYDRALARVPQGVEIVAPLFRDELLWHIPAEPHDRAVTTAMVAEPAGIRTVRLTPR